MSRVLVTGASGWIGRHALSHLVARDYEVHAVGRQRLDDAGPRVQWHHADLLDPAQSAALVADIQPTHLLHFAWYAKPGEYWTSLENVRWVEASLHLARVFAAHGGQRQVFAGTCAEYDWHYGYCSESVTPCQPATMYGICKHALQELTAALAAATGVCSAWGRIFYLYGPHEHEARLVPSVIRALLRGEPARCTHGNQVRDYMHVEDAAAAFVALLESDLSGAVNVASGQPVAVKDIVGMIAEMIGRPDLVRLGEIAASADDPPLLLADVRRFHTVKQWQPSRSLCDGLWETIRWWQDQNSDGPHRMQCSHSLDNPE